MTDRTLKYGDVVKPVATVAGAVHPATRMLFVTYNPQASTASFTAITLHNQYGWHRGYVGKAWAVKAWERDDD